MSVSTLSFSLIQTDLSWEDKEANLAMLAKKIRAIEEYTEVVVLPEMFSTGFSMRPTKFAESFAGGHFRIKSWGKQKIKYALQQKRVSPVNIKKALLTIDEDAYEKALLNLATKKWNSLKGEKGMSRMAKTQSFLNQRGFESNLISPILQALNKK